LQVKGNTSSAVIKDLLIKNRIKMKVSHREHIFPTQSFLMGMP